VQVLQQEVQIDRNRDIRNLRSKEVVSSGNGTMSICGINEDKASS